jgi:hypothetical protein
MLPAASEMLARSQCEEGPEAQQHPLPDGEVVDAEVSWFLLREAAIVARGGGRRKIVPADGMKRRRQRNLPRPASSFKPFARLGLTKQDQAKAAYYQAWKTCRLKIIPDRLRRNRETLGSTSRSIRPFLAASLR